MELKVTSSVKLDMSAVGLDGFALEHDLAGDVALRIVIVLALDVDDPAGCDSMALTASGASLMATQSTYSSVASISARNSALKTGRPGPLLTKRSAVTVTISDIAELAGGLEMADMAEMQQIEGAVRLNDDPPGMPRLLGNGGKLRHSADLVTRTAGSPDPRRTDQLGDFGIHLDSRSAAGRVHAPSLLLSQSLCSQP